MKTLVITLAVVMSATSAFAAGASSPAAGASSKIDCNGVVASSPTAPGIGSQKTSSGFYCNMKPAAGKVRMQCNEAPAAGKGAITCNGAPATGKTSFQCNGASPNPDGTPGKTSGKGEVQSFQCNFTPAGAASITCNGAPASSPATPGIGASKVDKGFFCNMKPGTKPATTPGIGSQKNAVVRPNC